MKITKIGKLIIDEHDVTMTGFHLDCMGYSASESVYRVMFIKVSLWAMWKLFKGMFQKPQARSNHFTDKNGNFVVSP